MNKWSYVSLGDILSESKIESLSPSADKRIRVKLNAKGVFKRPVVSEKVGKTKYFRRTKGQFIYGKQNLHKGAFGIVPEELDGFESSSDLPAFDVDSSCLPEWIIFYLKQGNYYKSLIRIASGAATKRIQPKLLFKIEIPLPPIEIQKELVEKFRNQLIDVGNLHKEYKTQQTLLTQLRQAILQEAIQGKLTEQWRSQNPNQEHAQVLLDRIKAEKAALVKTKKIKKEKPLLPIAAEEIPFELPKGWVWCRLGEVCKKTGSGKTPKGGRSVYVNEGVKFIRSQNVYDDGLREENIAYIKEDTHKGMKGTKVLPNDLLLNITGGSIGRCAIVPDDFTEANINQHVSIIRFINSKFEQFFHKVIIAPFFQKEILNVQTGAGREGLPKSKMDNMLIPLPPLSEQQAIVQKVEQLLHQVSELETEVAQSQVYAEQLMQAVLKEAFE